MADVDSRGIRLERYESLTRERPYYKHSPPDDPSRPTPPAAPPAEPQPPGGLESLRSKLMWWEGVRAWLCYLADRIYEAWDKDTENLAVLPPLPGINDRYRTRRGMPMYDPSRVYIHYTCAEQRQNGHPQQPRRRTCSVHDSFDGRRRLPTAGSSLLRGATGGKPADKKALSADHIATVSDFFQSHKEQMYKYMDHLDYLLDLIEETLIPQAEDKILELKWRQTLVEAELPDRVSLVQGVVPEEEEDYPESTYFGDSEEDEEEEELEEESYHEESNEGKEMYELMLKVQGADLSGGKGGSNMTDNEEVSWVKPAVKEHAGESGPATGALRCLLEDNGR
ncbi:unnamed protein product [Urochloa humidicola]